MNHTNRQYNSNREAAPMERYTERDPSGLTQWISRLHFLGKGSFYELDSAVACTTGRADIDTSRSILNHLIHRVGWVIAHPTARPPYKYLRTPEGVTRYEPDPHDMMLAPSWSLSCLRSIARAHPACPRCKKFHATLQPPLSTQGPSEAILTCEECSFSTSTEHWRGRSTKSVPPSAEDIIANIGKVVPVPFQRRPK